MYKVIVCYTEEVVYESNDIYDCIKYLKDNELKEYNEYLDYCQKCYDNYEDPTIDEIPADFYPYYYLIYDDKYYDITNIASLLNVLRDS